MWKNHNTKIWRPGIHGRYLFLFLLWLALSNDYEKSIQHIDHRVLLKHWTYGTFPIGITLCTLWNAQFHEPYPQFKTHTTISMNAYSCLSISVRKTTFGSIEPGILTGSFWDGKARDL